MFSLQESAAAQTLLRDSKNSLANLATPSTQKQSEGAATDAPLTDARELILSLLGPSPVSVDELIRAASLSARDVHGVLLELDLETRIERHGVNLVSLRVGAEKATAEKEF